MPEPGQAEEEAALIERARDGDKDAYDTLVRRYQEVVFRTAYVITTDAGEAEDAAQEAFVKAYRALGRFRRDAPFRPWIVRIAANEARNRRRSARRRMELRPSDTSANLVADPADPAPGPEQTVLRRERQAALLEALQDLAEGDRTVIAYRYFFELSETEMADALGVARGTVKSRLSRALERLRHRFPELADRARGGGAERG
jgi:RNA polymerase sigma-70 factor (ECF subfamily)